MPSACTRLGTLLVHHAPAALDGGTAASPGVLEDVQAMLCLMGRVVLLRTHAWGADVEDAVGRLAGHGVAQVLPAATFVATHMKQAP